MGELTWVNYLLLGAGVAQLVEQLICNQQVGGSSPFASFRFGAPPSSSDKGLRRVGVDPRKPPENRTLLALYALWRAGYFFRLVRKTAAPAFRGRLFSTSDTGGGRSFEWSRPDGFGSKTVGYRSGQTGQTVNLLA